MTGGPPIRAPAGERELELAGVRLRHAELAIMLGLEVLCATCGVAAFLAILRAELGWSALFAIASAIAYLAADWIERG